MIPTQAVAVYDRSSGEIVHIHAFVPARPGGTMPVDELRDAAMEMASRFCGTESLSVADVPEELLRQPGRRLAVDPKSGKVGAEAVAASEAAHHHGRNC